MPLNIPAHVVYVRSQQRVRFRTCRPSPQQPVEYSHFARRGRDVIQGPRGGAKRLVVGHTVQKDGISSACQQRLFRIDVGLSAYYGDNPAQVLELTAQGARVLKVGAAPLTIQPGPVKKGKAADSALGSSRAGVRGR